MERLLFCGFTREKMTFSVVSSKTICIFIPDETWLRNQGQTQREIKFIEKKIKKQQQQNHIDKS